MDPNLLNEMKQTADRANALIRSAVEQGLTQDELDMEWYLIQAKILREAEAIITKYGHAVQHFVPGIRRSPLETKILNSDKEF